MSGYINLNGEVIEAGQPVFTHHNRAFRYGDALFETIRLMNNEILYLDKHLDRLNRSMKILGMEGHRDFTFQKLHLLIRHLEQVNNLHGNGRIRFEVFREDGGYYTPLSNNVSYLIEAEPIEPKQYQLNESGLKMDFFSEITKPIHKLSNLKSSNALPYIMAGIYKMNGAWDDCIIFNSEGNIAEAISSNIFLVQREEISTPSLEQGCVAGVMREVVMELIRSEKKKVIEKKITSNDLLNADEIFLTNVIDGIRWVGAIKSKRYFNKYSRTLLQKINEGIANMV